MDMRDYHSKRLNITLSPERRKEVDLFASPAERTALQQLAGTLNFLGHAFLSPACYFASFLQQQLAHLRVSHLFQANTLSKALLHLEPILHFPCSPVTRRDIRILAWSDAAHGSTYGQSGYLGGIRLSADHHTTSVFHLCWVRVFFSTSLAFSKLRGGRGNPGLYRLSR
jgi:hypothetical protein